jgi:hypothetical protein
MLLNLDSMNHFAGLVERTATNLRGKQFETVRKQLQFIGDDNTLKNREAVVRLMGMGTRKPKYLSEGMASGLDALLPGVKVHVLGPPTAEQAPDLKKQTKTQKDEFWHLRKGFWASRRIAAEHVKDVANPLFPGHVVRVPWDARWYRYKAQAELAENLLSIVRTLDGAMNNTSLILLFEVGDACLLFPGDAQWENWQHALSQKKYLKLLKRVSLYKVGHHGSLNATPKTLWKSFAKRGPASKTSRLLSMMSTKDDVHGDTPQTAVPRTTLVTALKADTTLRDTRAAKPAELALVQPITV